METRLPFQYGIASVTHLPHIFVRVTAEVNGRHASGLSSENLAPKWFTKDPDTSFEDHDLPRMMMSLRHAAALSLGPSRAVSFFDWWYCVYQGQMEWAAETGTPPLLASLGVSLLERAVLDACCRDAGTPLFDWLRTASHGIEPAALRPGTSHSLVDILPAAPISKIHLRHTVGLGDPLTAAQAADRPSDGLPFTLEEHLKTHQLTHLKIKLSGDLDQDSERLCSIHEVLSHSPSPVVFTLDGNENYQSLGQFREHWESLLQTASVRALVDRSLVYVEQPVHRTLALDESIQREFAEWQEAPKVIIDESDADLAAFPRALELGYSGTSHKNCKGVVKSLVNLATIRAHRNTSEVPILSGEDLMNVGPVALHQDLAVCGCLGINHAERNGHHYFRGLSHLSPAEQHQIAADHPALYTQSDGLVHLAVSNGTLDIRDCLRAPFGYISELDLNQFDRVDVVN